MTGTDKRGLIVQERDKHLLRGVNEMCVVDGEQAMWAGGFGSKTRANARLLALTNAGLLRRWYLGTGGSGQKALYSLSRKGANLVQVPYRGLRRRRDETLVADFGVIHQLRINGLYCLLKYRPIPVADARFLRWESFHQPIDSGKALIPDGYVEIAKGARSLRHFWKSILGMRAALSGERKSRTTKTMQPPVISGDGSRNRSFGRSSLRILNEG